MKKYLTEERIDRESLIKELEDGGLSGSVIVFEGIVRRDKIGDNHVVKIIYEAYDELAEKEMMKIEDEALRLFDINKVVMRHRTGDVPCGETSLFVGVSSQHREDGFRAIQYIIDNIKKRVPIWKKEVLDNGDVKWV